jgi:hypothetical protein
MRLSLLVGTLALIPACAHDAAPSITVTSPSEGMMIEATTSVDGSEPAVEIDVAFSVERFTLKAPGSCDGASRCGHIHLLVDGDSCNDAEATGKLPFNEEAIASPASVNLIYCKDVVINPHGITGVDGQHVVSLALFDDDEHPVNDPDGKAISTSVGFAVVLVQPAGAGGGGGA